MVFSDTTNKNGIIQECEDMTNLGDGTISGTTDTLKRFTAYINNTLSEIWHIIFTNSGLWKYDDSNQTDLPQAVADLESGTSTYALPSSALTVERVEIKDQSGEWFRLYPLQENDIVRAVDEFHQNDATPRYYRLIGTTLELFPGPNYNSTGGLKVYFSRGSVSFATSDTTDTPGFASEYHEAVPLGASYRYMRVKAPEDPTTAILKQDYFDKLKALGEFYQRRFKDYKPKLVRKHATYR